ncbi:copper amine oxidase N-terminal domain-containing protein [Paenibacillus sp.]|uniref:copper amine oxidase N-terminal domain-containing protein n=1 Tax=Paenibacillus sp. TaxID=58172 RepID=UPI002D6C3145|nr:copper amine oxidase N-terminal domain-containing protein [Paenibacillus sp.]HZG56047.1 copper amine oxidase N-terminal domain-containing protein [Paenibacillus sp.]
MRRKAWVIPLMVAASFAVSGLAWAEGKYRTIEAFFDRIDYRINGQAAAVRKESFIYNGSIYVPLRTVAELLGAKPFWDAATRSVTLEFVGDDIDALLGAANEGMYQYISLEHNRVVESLATHLRSGDAAGIRADIEAWAVLRDVSLEIGDEDMADSFAKLMAAAEVLRSGWASKTFEDYMVAWQLLRGSYEELRGLLQSRLAVAQAAQ